MVYDHRHLRTFVTGISIFQDQDAMEFYKDLEFILREIDNSPKTLLKVLLISNQELRGEYLSQILNYDFSLRYTNKFLYIHKFLDLFDTVLLQSLKVRLSKTMKTYKSLKDVKDKLKNLYLLNNHLTEPDQEYQEVLIQIRSLSRLVRHPYVYEHNMMYIYISDEVVKDLKSNKTCLIRVPVTEQEVYLPKKRPVRLTNMVNNITDLKRLIANKDKYQLAYSLFYPESVTKGTYYKQVTDLLVELGISNHLGKIMLQLSPQVTKFVSEYKLMHIDTINKVSDGYNILTEDLIEVYKFLYQYRDRYYSRYQELVDVLMSKVVTHKVTVGYRNRKVMAIVTDEDKEVTTLELEVESN